MALKKDFDLVLDLVGIQRCSVMLVALFQITLDWNSDLVLKGFDFEIAPAMRKHSILQNKTETKWKIHTK